MSVKGGQNWGDVNELQLAAFWTNWRHLKEDCLTPK